MGRTYVYHCDTCKKPFGEDPHINIRSGQAFISYLRKDGNKKGWKQSPVNIGCPEKHFCNSRCFSKFFSKIFNELLIEVKGKNESDKS
jgi:hypothetical protein